MISLRSYKQFSGKLTLVLALGGIAVLSGCATAPHADAPVAKQTITCNVPTFTPIAGTKESQEKGGIRIFVTPGVFNCVPHRVVTRERVNPELMDTLMAKSNFPGYQPGVSFMVQDKISQTYDTSPDRVYFQITVKNNLPRVFRGTGTVVMFNLGGKNQSVKQDDFSELSGLIVPPQSETQVTISGPSVSLMPDGKNVGLYLYDVVTKTDAAGNVQEKQNFEWYFTYSVKSELHEVEVKTGAKHWTNS